MSPGALKQGFLLGFLAGVECSPPQGGESWEMGGIARKCFVTRVHLKRDFDMNKEYFHSFKFYLFSCYHF